MKKTMILLLCFISILISVAFGFYEKSQDNKRFDIIELTANSTYIYVKDANRTLEEELVKFKKLAKDFDASLIRTDTYYNEGQKITYKSGIYAENYFSNLDIKLAEGRFPKSNNEFLATFDTEKHNQSGMLNDLFNDNKVIWQPLDVFYKEYEVSVNTTYTLDVNANNKEAVLTDLSDFFEISQEDLLTKTSGMSYGEGTVFLLSIILAVIVVAIFCLMNVFYPISRLKEIGVMKLQGYKYIDIWKRLNKQIILFPFIFYVLSIGIQKMIIQNSGVDYFIKLSAIQIGILVGCLIFSLLMLVVIKKYSISAMLKNFFNFKFSLYFSYLLKFLIFVGVVFAIPQITIEVNRLIQDYQVQSLYEDRQNYVTLSSFEYYGNELDESLKGNDKLAPKMYEMFKELESTADCQFFNANRSNMATYELMKSTKWKDVKFDSNDVYNVVDANENYIEKLGLEITSSLDEIFSNQELSVLVPENLKNQEDKVSYYIHDRALQFLYDSYEEYPSNVDDVHVNIIYYNNTDLEIFSENIDMIDENNGLIKNPIIFCLDEQYLKNQATIFESSSISNPIRIKDTKENQKAISKAITNHDLENNAMQFGSVFSTGFANEMLISQTSVSAWGAILALTIIVSILSSYYIILIILISKKKQMLVSRLLGYPMAERYKNEIFYFVAIYLFCFAEILILSPQVLSLIMYLVMVVIDATIIYLMTRKREKKSLALALKGEE